MISWHSVPNYSRKGFVYKPEINEDEEGVRKATHYCVNRVDPMDVMIAPQMPYDFLTEKEFNDFIDKMVKVTS
tara:strand:+ start:14724 stop:14942 length:219 start_codon:yes stop_codon:yes gene_type:complete